MALKAVFLDAGGTLIHLDRAFILRALEEQGLSRSEPAFFEAADAARVRMEALLRTGAPGDDASRWSLFWATLMDGLGCYGMTRERVHHSVAARFREGRLWSHVLPGTADVLMELRRRGVVVGVVSNADGRVESYLEAAGLREHLDFVVDSAVVGVEKPDPRIFEHALSLAGVAPDEAVHVGDLYEVDVVGATRAGVGALLLDPLDTQAALGCERVADITALPAWLAARFPMAVSADRSA